MNDLAAWIAPEIAVEAIRILRTGIRRWQAMDDFTAFETQAIHHLILANLMQARMPGRVIDKETGRKTHWFRIRVSGGWNREHLFCEALKGKLPKHYFCDRHFFDPSVEVSTDDYKEVRMTDVGEVAFQNAETDSWGEKVLHNLLAYSSKGAVSGKLYVDEMESTQDHDFQHSGEVIAAAQAINSTTVVTQDSARTVVESLERNFATLSNALMNRVNETEVGSESTSGTEGESLPDWIVANKDWTKVKWGNTPFTFSPAQGKAVKLIFDDFQCENAGVTPAEIFQAANTTARHKRVGEVFKVSSTGKRHEALGTMIVRDGSLYFFKKPKNSNNRT
ncbi:hypothetical protein [Rhodopirellula bahusiensis]|uniref:hypothetical protein n=1 Tax=Rhodopirellula bahusiensis TaxID=2014065 RepID=UPI003264F234